MGKVAELGLGTEERREHCAVQQKAFFGAFSEVLFKQHIFCTKQCCVKKKGIEGASVSQLVIALSQSMEPWKAS